MVKSHGRNSLFWLTALEGESKWWGRHGRRQRNNKLKGHICKSRHKAERAKQNWAKAINSESPPSDILPPTRLEHIPKQHCQWGNRCSNSSLSSEYFSIHHHEKLSNYLRKLWKYPNSLCLPLYDKDWAF